MDQRDHGKKVLGVLALHSPVNARRVRCRVPEHAEQPPYQVCEATLLTLLVLVLKRVDRQHRRVTLRRDLRDKVIELIDDYRGERITGSLEPPFIREGKHCLILTRGC